jgi:uncharacterized protein (UPF0276 family)
VRGNLTKRRFSRKAAIIAVLMAIAPRRRAKAQEITGLGEPVNNFLADFHIVDVKDESYAMFRIDFGALDPNATLIEVKADDRIVKLSAREVMDALGGWFLLPEIGK